MESICSQGGNLGKRSQKNDATVKAEKVRCVVGWRQENMDLITAANAMSFVKCLPCMEKALKLSRKLDENKVALPKAQKSGTRKDVLLSLRLPYNNLNIRNAVRSFYWKEMEENATSMAQRAASPRGEKRERSDKRKKEYVSAKKARALNKLKKEKRNRSVESTSLETKAQ